MKTAKRKAQSAKQTTRQILFIFFYFILTLCAMPYALCVYAEVVSSSELIDNAKEYDGKTIIYEGEVIGDIMARKDFAWLNINDGKNAIGIWAKKGLIQDIISTGKYKTVGDWVQIEGVFNQRCIQHGGDLDLHAENIKIVKAGRQIPEFLDQEKINCVIALGVVLFLVALMYMYSYKRLRK